MFASGSVVVITAELYRTTAYKMLALLWAINVMNFARNFVPSEITSNNSIGIVARVHVQSLTVTIYGPALYRCVCGTTFHF